MADAAWTLTPAGLARVLAEIDAGRETVVECGSGASTIAIGNRLAQRGGGSLHSLEHDPAWAARTRAELGREGLEDRVELIEAPLRPHPAAERECGWYDIGALAALPHGIDLLLVDGPPGPLAANGETRYPALPLLAPRLARGAIVVLDDVHRPGERAVAARWAREHAVELELRPRERIAIGVFSGSQDSASGGKSWREGR